MTGSDIAYLAALVEKTPSNYVRRKELIEELQFIYRNCQGCKFGYSAYHYPIMAELTVVQS